MYNEKTKDADATDRLKPLVRCSTCCGSGTILYNPNLNPDSFLASAAAKCSRCDGTGIMSEEDANTYDDENNYANREDVEQASRSELRWTHY